MVEIDVKNYSLEKATLGLFVSGVKTNCRNEFRNSAIIRPNYFASHPITFVNPQLTLSNQWLESANGLVVRENLVNEL